MMKQQTSKFAANSRTVSMCIRSRLKAWLWPSMLVLALLWSPAQARLVIEISGGEVGALPIAIVPFAGERSYDNPLSEVIRANLTRSGRFAPMATDRLPARPTHASEIDFSRWRSSGVDHMVIGRTQTQGDGQVLVQFQLFDALRGVQMAGYSITVPPQRLRKLAHQISDIVYERITGEKGAFDTLVSYVAVEQIGNERMFRLAVADADGHNEQIILSSKDPLMSPSWAPDGVNLAYVSFEEGRSQIYVQNIRTGQRERVAGFTGINSAPAWSPDGRYLAMTLSRDGQPDIYIMEVSSRQVMRITNSPGIDTEPAWAPDGRSLVFTSNRGGRPQIYLQALQGIRPQGSPRRLTFEGNYNARARFSPDGRHLAVVHGEGNRFRIGLLELESRQFRILTDTGREESPSFAPNGSMIIYATERHHRGVLEAVSVDGRSQQRLGASRGDVREPAWSPFISQN